MEGTSEVHNSNIYHIIQNASVGSKRTSLVTGMGTATLEESLIC